MVWPLEGAPTGRKLPKWLLVGVEAPLPPPGTGRKAIGRITCLPLIFGTPLTGAIIGGGGSEVGDEAVFRMLFPVAVDRGRELVLTTTGLGCHNFLDWRWPDAVVGSAKLLLDLAKGAACASL